MMEREDLLKRYFGHETFREGQKPLIDTIMTGRDVLGVLPTGAGKSVCYQLPALLLPGLTLVISPLISLMKDQVTALTAMGISAAYINSMLSPSEYMETFDRVAREEYKILYVAPERLLTNDFQRLTQEIHIPFVAVDEAHCVSQWGQDFRPSYLDIAEYIEGLAERPVVGAFTATATEVVKKDIIKLLKLNEPLCITTSFDRPNLFFDVEKPRDKFSRALEYILQHEGQCGIVYCATRKTVEQTYRGLLANGILASRYHAGLTDAERTKNQEDFIYDRCPVMVATNAFGMGIDKSNIRFVLHYNMPKDIESYYQEAGRAGRDGAPAQSVLFFSETDVRMARVLINASSNNEAFSKEGRKNVHTKDMMRLRRMIEYCKTSACFRCNLLSYFDENAPARCENCGNCIGEKKQIDITVESQKILSAVVRTQRRVPEGQSVTLIVRMLHGSRDKRLHQLGLDKMPTYGIMSDIDRMKIREYIDVLTEQGYLTQSRDNVAALLLTDRAWDVLRGMKRVAQAIRHANKEKADHRQRRRRSRSAGNVDKNSLYETLRGVRTELAKAESVPAYVIFSNTTLADMAMKRPENMKKMLQVSGVGQYKADHYGQVFLDAIRKWEEDK